MKRSWLLAMGFAASLAVLLAAIVWISLAALRLDRAEAEARRQAALEENVRLALWRMDSVLAPLVAQESARPYFAYETFLPLGRSGTAGAPGNLDSQPPIPSPLLATGSPYVLVHFQFEPDGRLTSPRVPSGNRYRLAVPKSLSAASVEQAQAALAEVATLADRQRLLALLPRSAPPLIAQQEPPPQSADLQQTRARGQVEFSRRSQALMQNAADMVQSQSPNWLDPRTLPATDVGGVLMTPLWIRGSLLLARRVVIAGKEYVQGCLLDWPAIGRWLLETTADLLPEARLEAVEKMPPEDESRLLAALPVRLLPGALPSLDDARPTPIRVSLGIAWAGVLLAATAVGLLVAGIERLSRRRAAFVSAVTHELRTPLTTFQMYTEMLAEGMVADPAAQRHYLETLRSESGRLTHLIENVLAYARLERGRKVGLIEPIATGQLLEQVADRLTDRAARSGMQLAVEADPAALALIVRANPSAAEQILLNLVDNACKYAAGAADRRIHLEVRPAANTVRWLVRDHGPGVPRAASRRLFRSFTKSAQEAAQSAPGIGLGLALSLRLARDMGGNLKLDPSSADGACFVLTLPR